MRVAILQSCYIPWKGYFDIIESVDKFVIYDDVQYRKQHWHNRNIIKTPNGPIWLTVPVKLPFGLSTKINEVEIGAEFTFKHWRSIENSYCKAPFFKKYSCKIEDLYIRAAGFQCLSDLNRFFLEELCAIMGIEFEFINSKDMRVDGDRTERLVNICEALGAGTYVSGPAAKVYLDENLFKMTGIRVEWMDYGGYPEYTQLHGPFDHRVSVIDLIFNTGEKARAQMRRQFR